MTEDWCRMIAKISLSEKADFKSEEVLPTQFFLLHAMLGVAVLEDVDAWYGTA